MKSGNFSRSWSAVCLRSPTDTKQYGSTLCATECQKSSELSPVWLEPNSYRSRSTDWGSIFAGESRKNCIPL